ncbi:MAG: NlpC/P60 family protein, partial [Hyphomicrobiales bacterium]
MTLNSKLDRRLHAFRDDLADEALKGQVESTNFTDSAPYLVAVSEAPLHREANFSSTMETQALMGETIHVFENKDGWCWGQMACDGYVGYVPSATLVAAQDEGLPTAQITVQRSFVYPLAELRAPALMALSMGSRVTVIGDGETRGTAYKLIRLPNGKEGAMIASHIQPISNTELDWVSLAEQFLHVPYLWGGRSSIGLDCSALVQITRLTAQKKSLRDSDMLGKMGQPIDLNADFSGLTRGDLIFWPGHVAIMLDDTRIIHSNGYHMLTAIEPLAVAE